MPEFDSTTEYRPIPDFPGYVAGSDGSIWSCRTFGAAARYYLVTDRWRQLKTAYVGGYRQVTLCGNGRKLSRHAHVLVLLAFVGPPESGHECRHLDGNRANNRLDNLAWGTRLENNQDKIAHGNSLRGSKSPHTKLTDDQVYAIRHLASEGRTGISLAKQFGVSNNSICRIILRRTWKNI